VFDSCGVPISVSADLVRWLGLADELSRASTYKAGYIALTQLQADAFAALDAGWP